MSRVRIKVCGLTRLADVEAAVAAGVDAVGFVFAASPRRIAVPDAARLLTAVPPGVIRVGLFMNQDRACIAEVLKELTLDLLQFHGTADNRFCRGFGLPFLRAVSAQDTDAASAARRYPDASGLLWDTPGPGGAGGTGRTFDWSLIGPGSLPLWLAGGLTPHNVGEAVRRVRPDWVDVSSGVEDAPGVKNAGLIEAFVRAVRRAGNDNDLSEDLN